MIILNMVKCMHVDVDCETLDNHLKPEHKGVTTRSRKRTSNLSLDC